MSREAHRRRRDPTVVNTPRAYDSLPRRQLKAQRRSLRGGFQFNDRKMLATRQVPDAEFESHTASPSHSGPRRTARRVPRPLPTRLESRRQAGGREIVVDLVRGLAVERFTGTVVVVPGRKQSQLAAEAIELVGDQQPSGALALDRPHQSLDDGNAAVLPDRTEALASLSPPAPSSEVLIGELAALVGDQMPRGAFGATDGSTEEGPDYLGGWLLVENRAEPMIRRE